MKNRYPVIAGLTLSAFASCGYASIDCTTIYGLAATVTNASGTQSGQSCVKTADNFFDLTKDSGLKSIAPTYDATLKSGFSSEGLFNAVKIQLSSALGSDSLTFAVPALNVNRTFTGSSRNASSDQLVDFLKKENIIGQIMKLQAQTSPTSPISGQGGLIPTMVATDFNQNITEQATNIAAPAKIAAQASSAGRTPNLIGVGADYTSIKLKDTTSNSVTIPLSYTWRNNIDPRRQLTFSLPLTVSDVDGAKAYAGALGVAYRVPMNDNWTLTPSARYGFVGSVDLATVAAAYSGAIASTYIIPRNGYDIVIGNMLSIVKTQSFKSGDYNVSPDITNNVMRNGVMFSQPVSMGGKRMSVEYSLIDTRYLGGDKPYADSSQEIGITIGTNKNAFDARSFLRGGFTYINAKDSKGFRLNFGYWF